MTKTTKKALNCLAISVIIKHGPHRRNKTTTTEMIKSADQRKRKILPRSKNIYILVHDKCIFSCQVKEGKLIL